MPKGLLFFCCACCILVLTIINLSVGPIISRTVGSSWGTNNCAYEKDYYDNVKKNNPPSDIEKKYYYEWNIDKCIREKGMYDMEYTSFIFDIVIGFVCGLLGLLHLFGVGNDFIQKTGIIGLGCGIVGFALTFVYVIFNGIVYTNYYDFEYYKRDSDGAFAEWKEGKGYECTYFDEVGNVHALIAKYSDLIKKQYNYNKKFAFVSEQSDEYKNCLRDSYIDNCLIDGIARTNRLGTCNKLYLSGIRENDNKNISDRFLTTLLLSLFVCIANIGLVIFGFMLYKTSGDFTKEIEVKFSSSNFLKK